MIINHNILCNIIGNKVEFVIKCMCKVLYQIRDDFFFVCVRFLYKIECEIEFSESNCVI